jgi:hypothetical protein
VQGYQTLQQQFPGMLSCSEDFFIRAVTDMKVRLPCPLVDQLGST